MERMTRINLARVADRARDLRIALQRVQPTYPEFQEDIAWVRVLETWANTLLAAQAKQQAEDEPPPTTTEQEQ